MDLDRRAGAWGKSLEGKLGFTRSVAIRMKFLDYEKS